MIYLNYTGHMVRIYNPATKTLHTLPPHGPIRVRRITVAAATLSDGTPTRSISYDVTNLPPKQADTYILVSTYALHVISQQYPDRDDVVAPDTSDGSAIRTQYGKLFAVSQLLIHGGGA